MVKRITAMLAVFVSLKVITMASPIPVDVKKVVAFVFLQSSNGQATANGTGFFVGVSDPINKERSFVYFVTARHVVSEPNGGPFYKEVFLRINKVDGKTSEFVKLPLSGTGPSKNVFTHSDPSVDIAVIPGLPDQKVFDFKFLDQGMVTTKEDYKTLGIAEGSDVFFTGLFTGFLGENRNYPVVRFGRVALVTEEKIPWGGTKMDLYLMESASYGGNSGSPVFFYLGSDRTPGSLIVGPPELRLAGIMMGAFQDIQPVKTVQTNSIPVSVSNMGIAAVVPSYKLHEILFGAELTKARSGK